MPAVTTVSSTGNQDIDGLLSGVKWATNALTFAFPTSFAACGTPYADGEPSNHLAGLNPTQQPVACWDFGQYASVASLHFTEVTETVSRHSDLRLAESDAPSTAWGYYPSTSPEGGDVWFNSSSHQYNGPVKGNYAFLTFLHEIGHALGLKYRQDSDSYGAMTPAHDSLEYSVMTYCRMWARPALTATATGPGAIRSH